jgi:RNA polymerase sigma-70 factor (ECF subfamily)
METSGPAPVQPDDKSLLRAIAGRDKTALRVLYERHAGLLFSLALKILGNRSDAEDVLQETFLQIWNSAGSYDDKRGKPLSWLVLLARSRSIDRLRSRQSYGRATEAVQAVEPKALPSPTQQAAASEAQTLVRRALSSLPPEQRMPVEMAYFGGLTQAEIAQRLGQPLGTVKTRMRAAMMRLREQLGGGLREEIRP